MLAQYSQQIGLLESQLAEANETISHKQLSVDSYTQKLDSCSVRLSDLETTLEQLSQQLTHHQNQVHFR